MSIFNKQKAKANSINFTYFVNVLIPYWSDNKMPLVQVYLHEIEEKCKNMPDGFLDWLLHCGYFEEYTLWSWKATYKFDYYLYKYEAENFFPQYETMKSDYLRAYRENEINALDYVLKMKSLHHKHERYTRVTTMTETEFINFQKSRYE